MKVRAEIATSLSHPAVVGTIHSGRSLEAAQKIRRGECDWLELRVDNFFPNVRELRRVAPRLACPRIVTVRHGSEGGMGQGMTARERRGLYADFIEGAGLVDIELRKRAGMKEVMRQAQEGGAGLILSYHDFHRTPPLEKLREQAERALDAGADVFKVAAMTRTGRELATLIEFLTGEKRGLRLAVMGMGSYGRVSRLVLAQAGSCLNYGYLGEPNASGQWPAALLKARIAELLEPEERAPEGR